MRWAPRCYLNVISNRFLAMDAHDMERVWHGSHRKSDRRNWSLYFALTLLGLIAWVIVVFPH